MHVPQYLILLVWWIAIYILGISALPTGNYRGLRTG